MTHIEFQLQWRRLHVFKRGVPPPVPSRDDKAKWAACVAPQLGELAAELSDKWGDDRHFLDVANLLKAAQFRLMDRVAPRQEHGL